MRRAAIVAGLVGLYTAAGWLGRALVLGDSGVPPVWPPTGIAIAAALIFGARVWPAVALGAWLVNMGATGAVTSSLAIAAGNTAEALGAAWLVTRFANGARAFDTLRSLFKYIALAGLVSTSASATMRAAGVALGDHAAPRRLVATWLSWRLSDAIGALVVAPPILLWYSSRGLPWTRRRAHEAALWLAFVVVVLLAIFSDLLPLEHRQFTRGFPLTLLLACVALRFGTREAATGLLLYSGIASWGTAHGFGPFVMASPTDSLLLLQLFQVFLSILVLATAVVIVERRPAEARLQGFFDQAMVGIADCDFDGRFLRVNGHFCDMLGYTREQLLARTLIEITHPEDRNMTRARLERVMLHGTMSSLDKRYLRADGTTLWVRALASRVAPGAGQDAFAATVVEDITARRVAEAALHRTTKLEERSRLAAEIHDRLAQSFVGIVLQLENAGELLPSGSDGARLYLDRATQLARTALDHARHSLKDLEPTALEAHDLPTALRAAATGLLAGTGVELDFGCAGAVRRLPPEIEEQTLYLGMEAVANAWRHGQLTRLSCRLRYGSGDLQLEVVDDGSPVAGGQVIDRHFGLVNLEARARRLGAKLRFQNEPGRGNSLQVLLPLGAL